MSGTHDGSDKEPKVPTPALFYGQREKLEGWLLEFDMYYAYNGRKIGSKGLFATTYLRGLAQKWVAPYVKSYLRGEETYKKSMDDWGKFKELLKDSFGNTENRKKEAARAVQNMRQKRSTAEYAAAFKQYSLDLKWGKEADMANFRRGLKDHVKEGLIHSAAEIEDLDTLIKEAVEIDDAYYDLQMEKKKRIGTRERYPRGTKDYGDPMEIDAFQRTSRKGKKSFKGKGKNKPMVCWNCDKPGHIAKDCRMNKVHRPQINMLRRLDPTRRGMRTPPDSPGEDPLEIGLSESEDETWERVHAVLEENSAVEIPEDWEHLTQPPENIEVRGGGVSEEDNPDEEQELRLRATGPALHIATAGWEDVDVPDGISQYEENLSTYSFEYATDPRNYLHRFVDWPYCTGTWCRWHFADKQETASNPVPECRRFWNNCREDTCPWHLWDKRTNGTFPGKTPLQNRSMRDNAKNTEWGTSCEATTWIYCLSHRCEQHKEEKTRYGFLPKN